jgi:hypothetical protein
MRRRILDAAFLAIWLSLHTFVAQAQKRDWQAVAKLV